MCFFVCFLNGFHYFYVANQVQKTFIIFFIVKKNTIQQEINTEINTAIRTCLCEEANNWPVATPSRTKSHPEVSDECCFSSWIAYDKYFLFILLLILTTPSSKRRTNPRLHPQNRFRYRHRGVQCSRSKQAARPAHSWCFVRIV